MFDLVYIKVENNPSTRYYEKKQREVVIKASESIKALLKKMRKKSLSMATNDIKIFLNMKNKSWLYMKNYYKM